MQRLQLSSLLWHLPRLPLRRQSRRHPQLRISCASGLPKQKVVAEEELIVSLGMNGELLRKQVAVLSARALAM